MNKLRKIFFYFFVLIVFSGCSHLSLFKETRIVMDTFTEISCFSSDRKNALDAMNEAFKEMKRIERLFSKFDEESELSRINRLGGIEKINIDPEVFRLIKDSLYYSEISEGNFDITIAPLIDVWRKAREDNIVPDDGLIDEALQHVGYEKIMIDEESLSIHFLDKDTRIDLGATAKGYAVDRAKDILLSHGIEKALVNLGGNIFTLGSPPRKKAWQIGIQHPRDKNKIIYKLDLKDRAISTSGDYERFFMLGGKRFSHIIDPKDGRPSEGVMSVTIVASSAERADWLSTAVFVMGVEKGLEFMESFKDVEAFIFDKDLKLIRYP